MAAVLADDKKVAFLASPDLKTWHLLSEFGPAGAADGAWECPDLFAATVRNTPGEVRWVLKVDVFRSASAGSGAQYFVGRFDGHAFQMDADGAAQPVDYGRDFYAAASWSNLPDGAPHLWIAWMNNHDYAQDIPTTPWRGVMTVPREVSLRHVPGRYELLQSPVGEIARLRAHHRSLARVRVTDGRRPVTLASRLDGSSEIIATMSPGDAREFGLQVRVGPHERTIIGYEVASQRIFIDRSQSGRVDFNERFPGRQRAPLVLGARPLRLRVLLDRSSVEVFAGDGERVLSDQIFPAGGSLGLRAYARGGTAVIEQADLWDLTAERR